jgi:hypothetical protein
MSLSAYPKHEWSAHTRSGGQAVTLGEVEAVARALVDEGAVSDQGSPVDSAVLLTLVAREMAAQTAALDAESEASWDDELVAKLSRLASRQ